MSCHVSQHVQGRYVRIARHAHAGKPAALIIRGMPEITYGRAVPASQTIDIKITTSHFNALNTKIANQNVLERILISMLNENTAVSNENLRN